MKSRTKIVLGLVFIAAMLAVTCYTSTELGNSTEEIDGPEELPHKDPGNGGTAGSGDGDDQDEPMRDPGNGGTAGKDDEDMPIP